MDLPAAHSMDTCWFAVDGEGRVALFESHEAGAVPHSWSGSQRAGSDLAEKLQIVTPPGPLPREIVEAESQPLTPAARPERYEDLLLRLSSARVYELLPFSTALSPDLRFVACPSAPRALIDELLARGLIERVWENYRLSPSHFGLYVYRHGERWENWIAGPYERTEVPLQPLEAGDLPERWRAMAASLPGLSFGDEPSLQPVEWVPSHVRTHLWLALDGRQRELSEAWWHHKR